MPTSSSTSFGHTLLTPARTAKEVPKFSDYATEFMDTYVIANNKPSERSTKACTLKHYLLPAFGDVRLDAIKMHPIEVFKASLLAKGLSPKRVNNILACLGKMLRYAHEVELIEVVPRVKLLKIPQQKFDFLTFDELSRLIEAVKGDPERLALVLLGADAGLRQGELIALAVERRGFGRRSTDCSAFFLEGHRWNAEEWSGTQSSADGATQSCAQGASAFEIRVGVLPRRWKAVHAVRNRGSASVRLQAGWAPDYRIACASPHLLLAPRHARCCAEGDSGARRPLDAQHDASVHAFGAECASRGDWAARLWAARGQCRKCGGLK